MTESRGAMADPSEIFPQRLREARELRKLSQAELATRAKLQPSAVSHFETGTRRPSFDNLKRLADALTVSTDYLLGRSDSINGAATTDILYRDIARLSSDDREMAASIVAKFAARNTRREGDGGKGT
jgi:transcriptional regulator with XRE-family HTH domain